MEKQSINFRPVMQALSGLGRGANQVAPGIQRGLRYAAKVPAGEAFFSGGGAAAKRMLRLGFNPHLGKANVAKHGINATALYGLLNESVWKPWKNLRDSPLGQAAGLPEVTAGQAAGGAWDATKDLVFNQPSIPALDKQPQVRKEIQEAGKDYLETAPGAALGGFSKIHPSRWFGDKWNEPFNILASPLSKPVAAAIHGMWNPTKPGEVFKRYRERATTSTPIRAINSALDSRHRDR